MMVLTISHMSGSRQLHLSLFQPDDETRAAPRFEVMPIDQSLGYRDGFVIVGTDKRFETYDVASMI
jgi:hypothetical protein